MCIGDMRASQSEKKERTWGLRWETEENSNTNGSLEKKNYEQAPALGRRRNEKSKPRKKDTLYILIRAGAFRGETSLGRKTSVVSEKDCR